VDLLVDFGSGTIHTTVPQPEAQGATVHLYESASVIPSASPELDVPRNFGRSSTLAVLDITGCDADFQALAAVARL
jgi:hypothetical protein